MNVKALKAAGWTISQIAKHLGYHPATVSGWLKSGGPPPKRSVPVEELVIDEHWRARIAALLAHNDELQATSIMRVIGAEGFDGSLSVPHPPPARGPGTEALRCLGGDGADRDRPRRGVPVRLVGRQPLGPPLGLGR
jgi:hypothetical protein